MVQDQEPGRYRGKEDWAGTQPQVLQLPWLLSGQDGKPAVRGRTAPSGAEISGATIYVTGGPVEIAGFVDDAPVSAGVIPSQILSKKIIETIPLNIGILNRIYLSKLLLL